MAENEVKVRVALEDLLSKGLDKAGDQVEKFGNGIKNNFEQASHASKALAIGLAAVGTAVIGAIAISVKAAADAEKQMARVNAVLGTMGKKGLEARAGILKAADAAVQLGFDDETAAESVTNLFQRTGDLNQAMELNALAMDLARAKNIDLAQATNLVGQVLAGNGKVLKQYGIDINEAATPLAALDELQKKVAGQSTEYAKTFSGQMEVLSVQFGNLKEAIGGIFLPVLTRLIQEFNKWIEMAGGVDGIMKMLKGTLAQIEPWFPLIAAGLTGALIPAMIAAGGAVITMLSSFSIAASALLPWIALAVAAYEAYTHNFLGIKDFIDNDFVPWFEENFAGLSEILREHGGVIGTMKDAWVIVKTEWSAFFEIMRLRWTTWFQDLRNNMNSTGLDLQFAWRDTWNAIETFITDKLNAIKNFFKGWYDTLVGWINSLLEAIGLVEKKSSSVGKSSSRGSTGRFAFGGEVTGPLGLDNIMVKATAGEVILNAAQQNNVAAAIDSAPRGGGVTVIVSGNSFYGDDRQFSEKIGETIVKSLLPHLTFSPS